MNIDLQLDRHIEALLFASTSPLTAQDLISFLPSGADLAGCLNRLVDKYRGCGVNLVCIGDHWQFRTAPDLAHLMVEVRDKAVKLSKAALETLAIIAYHQPVTRSEIELVRGVGVSRSTIEQLFELNLIRLKGRRRSPGRPVTFATTDRFLEIYSLASLHDLPGLHEMKAAGLIDIDIPDDFKLSQLGGMLIEEDPIGQDEPLEGAFSIDYISENAS